MWSRHLLAAVLSVFVLQTPTWADAGPVILTVTGTISETNRGPVDPMRDRFFAANDVAFDAAYTFDIEALAALEQGTATARGCNWPEAITVSGPTLEAILDVVGAPDGATLIVTALDGYQAEITASDQAQFTWVLATHMQGEALAIGGTGPSWIIPDRGNASVPKGGGSKWVWSVYLIEVK